MTDPQDNERLLRSGLRDLAGQATFQPIYPTAVKATSRSAPWRAIAAGAIGVGAVATALIVAFAVGGAGVHPNASVLVPAASPTHVPGDGATSTPARDKPITLLDTSWLVTHVDGKPAVPGTRVVFFESDFCWSAEDTPGGTPRRPTCTTTPAPIGLATAGLTIDGRGSHYLLGVLRGYGIGFTYTQDGPKIVIPPFEGTATKEEREGKMAAGFDWAIPGYTTQALAFTHALESAASFTGDAKGITVFDAKGAERLRLVPAN